jgi:hypothetical protein
MDEPPATEVDRAALDAVRKLGMETREVTLPDWPYGSLNTILFAEADFLDPVPATDLVHQELGLRSPENACLGGRSDFPWFASYGFRDGRHVRST